MKIVLYPEPVLKQIAQPIKDIDDDIISTARAMVEAMHKAQGIGLAGPQVGLLQKIIVINPDGQPGNEEIYLNASILKRKGRVLGEEGCLSLPGIYASVMRAQWVRVQALKLNGEQVTFEAEDLRARVLQHEIDHLSGVLFTSKVQPAEQNLVKRKLKEMEHVLV